MRRRLWLAALLVCAGVAVAGGDGVRADQPIPLPPHATRRPSRSATTDCAACHVESGWTDVRFDHRRTGFSLEGAHAAIGCRTCHRQDFRTAIPDSCAGCHRDRHASEFGQHCEGCHDEKSWRAALFQADGHRSTGFPLVGKHAAIPCQECHGNRRDASFTRAPLSCVSCHRADYDGAKLRSIDHAAAGFGTDCRGCHSAWSFFPARFAAHDLCFEVSAGPHRPFRCQQCHTSIAGLMLTGTCNTQTLTCISCHSHQCATSDGQHPNVPGYACVNEKCYQCHQQAGR